VILTLVAAPAHGKNPTQTQTHPTQQTVMGRGNNKQSLLIIQGEEERCSFPAILINSCDLGLKP
jgi:hypothetical protein